MKVLMITGDKMFTPGNPRFELQHKAVEELAVVYWGRGSMWPALPKGVFDVVTVQDPFWRGLFGWLAAKRKHARFNVQVHADLSAQSGVKHVLAQIVLRHADSVRVVSEKLKAQVEHMGVKAPVRVLPVFVDVSRFVGLPHEAQQRKTILWFGRFEQEKNPLYAIEVLRQVRARGIDAVLLIAGKGSLEPMLHKAAEGLPVEFLPWGDPRPYIARADVVLFTSPAESYAAGIIEALAAGVPVVSRDVGIARDAGAIIKDKDELVSGILEVLQKGMRGTLKLTMPSAEEWAQAWKHTL